MLFHAGNKAKLSRQAESFHRVIRLYSRKQKLEEREKEATTGAFVNHRNKDCPFGSILSAL